MSYPARAEGLVNVILNINDMNTIIWFQVFVSNTNKFVHNYIVSVIPMNTIIWFQVFVSNTNKFVHNYIISVIPI